MAIEDYNKGWIKLHRKLLNSQIWKGLTPKDKTFDKRAAWIEMLLRAAYQEHNLNENTKLEPGDFWVSRIELAQRWHWSRKKVDRFFDALVEQGNIRYNGVPSGTLVSIVNWRLYQDLPNSNDQTNDATNDQTNDQTNDAHIKNGLRKDKEEKEKVRGWTGSEGRKWKRVSSTKRD